MNAASVHILRKILFACLVVLVLLAGAFATYISAVRQAVTSENQKYLSEITEQSIYTINQQINNNLQIIKALAANIEWPEDSDFSKNMALLREACIINQFKRLGIVFPDGSTLTTDEVPMSLKDRTYIRDAFAGSTSVTNTLVDKADGMFINVYATPITRRGIAIAVLIGTQHAEIFQKFLSVPLFNGQGSSYVVKNDGTKIFKAFNTLPSNSDNIFADLKKLTINSHPPISTLQDNLLEGKSGFFDYQYLGSRYYMNYKPLHINDWYFLSIVPASVFKTKSEYFLQMTFYIAGTVIVLFVLLFVYIYITETKYQQSIQQAENDLLSLTANIPGGVVQCRNDEQLSIIYINDEFCAIIGYAKQELLEVIDNSFVHLIEEDDLDAVRKKMQMACLGSEPIEIEYRIRHKNGNRIWVKERTQLCDDGNNFYFYSVILDNNTERLALQRILLDAERYNMLLNLSDSIIFDVDMQTGEISYSKKHTELFGELVVGNNFPQSAIDAGTIYHEDIPHFVDFFERLYGGAEYIEQEMRLKSGSGEFWWCNVSATTLLDPNQISSKIIGRIDIIESNKRQIEELTIQNQRDPFTKLYNKVATVEHIREYINRPDHLYGVFFAIDIDNFKSVNDVYGHAGGDSVILGLTQEIKKVFRSSDIMGRIGGDEFAVFARDINDLELFTQKIPLIVSSLNYHIEDKEHPQTIHTSIGIAFFPQDGTTYEELYKRADEALYYTKNHKGKNGFSLYSEVLASQKKGLN